MLRASEEIKTPSQRLIGRAPPVNTGKADLSLRKLALESDRREESGGQPFVGRRGTGRAERQGSPGWVTRIVSLWRAPKGERQDPIDIFKGLFRELIAESCSLMLEPVRAKAKNKLTLT